MGQKMKVFGNGKNSALVAAVGVGTAKNDESR